MSVNNDQLKANEPSNKSNEINKVTVLDNRKQTEKNVDLAANTKEIEVKNKDLNEDVQGVSDIKNESGQLISSLQSKLRNAWIVWLLYRGLIFPILLGVLLSTHPNIVGGIAWQWLWLVPAFIITPWMISGKSPYALLLSSMLTLVYLGASGVVLFERFYDIGINVIWVYAIDTLLLLLINVWLFKLLKRLPSMNKSV